MASSHDAVRRLLQRAERELGITDESIRLRFRRDVNEVVHNYAKALSCLYQIDQQLSHIATTPRVEELEQLTLCASCSWEDVTLVCSPELNASRESGTRFHGSFRLLGSIEGLESTARAVRTSGLDELEAVALTLLNSGTEHPALQARVREISLELVARLDGEMRAAFCQKILSEVLVQIAPRQQRGLVLSGAEEARKLYAEALASSLLEPARFLVAVPVEFYLDESRTESNPLESLVLNAYEVTPNLHLLESHMVAWLESLSPGGLEQVELTEELALLETVLTLYEPGGEGAFTSLADALEAARAL